MSYKFKVYSNALTGVIPTGVLVRERRNPAQPDSSQVPCTPNQLLKNTHFVVTLR